MDASNIDYHAQYIDRRAAQEIFILYNIILYLKILYDTLKLLRISQKWISQYNFPTTILTPSVQFRISILQGIV